MKARILITALVMAAEIVIATPTSWAAGTGADADGSTLGMPPVARLIAGNLGRFLVMASELNVTQQQKQQIRATVKRHREEIKPAAQAVLAKRQALREAVLTKPGDEQAIRQAATELGKVIGDAALVASKVVAEARGALKPDQLERIRQFRLSADKATTEWVGHIGE